MAKYTSKPAIGLLGGSFNPAHEGHVHLSREAMKTLGLEQVLWLVSPANPLKKRSELEEYDLRVSKAKDITRDEPRIVISEYEHQHGLQYSADTLAHFAKTHPDQPFIWLMGADNLEHFHQWRDWKTLFSTYRMAVFDRAPYNETAEQSVTAEAFSAYKLLEENASNLASTNAPAWVYIHMPLHPQSGTQLRNSLGKDAFLRHNETETNA